MKQPAGKRRGKRKRISGIQIAVIVLGSILFLTAASFGGYVWYEEDQHQKALANYPVAYTDLIKQYAEQYKLDPYLVQAIIRCEAATSPTRSARLARSG